jgi:sugar/nucleoside kinase (ribokinase family)
MGLDTCAVAKIGDDEAGHRVEKRLQSLGIDTQALIYCETNFTGVSVILTGYTGDRTILTYRGASADMREEEVPWDVLAQARWMYVGSMSGDSAPLFVKLAQFAGEQGIKLALNPGGSQLRAGCEALRPALRHCEALFLNKREAYRLTGVEPTRTEQDEDEVFRALHDTGVQTVFITAGAEGVEASGGGERRKLAAYRSETVSTVGAGDAFAAGCLAALIRGQDLETAMKTGAMNGAAVVQTYGATESLLSWEEAQKLIATCKPGDWCPVKSVRARL